MGKEVAKTQPRHQVRNVRIKASMTWWRKVEALMTVNGHTTLPESFRAAMNNRMDRTDLSQA